MTPEVIDDMLSSDGMISHRGGEATRNGGSMESFRLLTNCDAEPDSPPPALLPVISKAHEGKFAQEILGPWLADKALARSPNGLGGLTYSDPTNLTDEIIEYYLSPLLSSTLRKSQANGYAIALENNPLAGIEASLRKSRVFESDFAGVAGYSTSARSEAVFSRGIPRHHCRRGGLALERRQRLS